MLDETPRLSSANPFAESSTHARMVPPASGSARRLAWRLSRQHARTRALALARHPEARRVVAYLFAGGVSALATIAATAAFTALMGGPFLIAAACGTELGILVNFSINDRFAFADLAGHRALPARLLRFHLTCATGQTIILISSVLLHDLARWPGTVAQALPIVLVTFVNFTLHRFWTYRGRQPHRSQ